MTWTEAEDPSKWGWGDVESRTARQGTQWNFVPAGCQFRNGLCESRVKALKHTLKHVVDGSTVNEKPTVSYVELQVFLAKAANILNDRPLGIRSLTEDDLVPLTPNQLLLGRTSTVLVLYMGF